MTKSKVLLELNLNGKSLSVVFTTSNSSFNPEDPGVELTTTTGFSAVTGATLGTASGAAGPADAGARGGAPADAGGALAFPTLEFAIFAMRTPSPVCIRASMMPTPL